jgi:hypothetical protein
MAKRTSATAEKTELIQIVREFFRELKQLQDNGEADRWLFPRGIDLIRVGVNIKNGTFDLTLSGGPVSEQSVALRSIADIALQPFAPDDLVPGQSVPTQSERDTVGAATTKIQRGTPAFNALVSNQNAGVVFKDEEGTGADRMMTTKLSARIDALATKVAAEWPGTKLRVTEAWDENNEHGTNSVHYEARAVDLTTQPIDQAKLGRLGRLAVNAGFEWVFFEDNHIHASMSK